MRAVCPTFIYGLSAMSFFPDTRNPQALRSLEGEAGTPETLSYWLHFSNKTP